MEREQRAIDAMRARRQAELDQMVALTSPVRAVARGMRTDVVALAGRVRGEAAASRRGATSRD